MSQVQDTSVILVCAGNATRMQGKNKILLPLGDTNVIGMSMRAFEACPRVAEIIVWHVRPIMMSSGKRHSSAASQNSTPSLPAVRPGRKA